MKKAIILLVLFTFAGAISAQVTKVSKTIVPLNASVPVVKQINVKGGVHQVADADARDAIDDALKETGMVVWVTADHAAYQWNGSAWSPVRVIRTWAVDETFYTGQLFLYEGRLFEAKTDGTIASGDNPATDNTNWQGGLPSYTSENAGNALAVNMDGTGLEWAGSVSLNGDVAVNSSGLVTVKKLQGVAISSTAPTTGGQALLYDGSQWAPGSVSVSDELVKVNGSATALPLNAAEFTAGASDITIAGAAVTNSKLAYDAVTSNNIADGTIIAADLGQMGAGNGQVMKWNGSAWAAADDNNDQTTVIDNLTSSSATDALSANQGNVLNTAVNEKLASSAVFGGDVSGTYSDLQLGSGVVGSTEITDGSIAAADLGQMGAGNGQVMKWNGSAWAAADDVIITDGTSDGNTLRWNGSAWVESTALTNDGTDVTATGNLSVTGDVAVNGGNLTTSSATAGVFNTTATTVNIGGASTATTIGASTGTTTIGNDLAVSGNAVLATGKTLTLANNSKTANISLSPSATANYNLVLPAAAPAADGQVLAGTTAGVLSWTSNGGKWYAENSAAPATAPSATGAGSVAFGSGAQAAGSGMFVYGSSAGNGATSAGNSNFLGNNAGNGATSAYNSNFLGYYAGNGATSAYSSNFIGNNAGASAASASNSNFLGSSAGYSATSASNSNFLGYQAGRSAADATYSNFLGYSVGCNAASASYSTLIGYKAGQASSSANSIGSNNIIMGTNISLPAATANAINIGGVLFGTGTYSDITTASTGAVSGGKIGIGVVTPVQTLEVNGDLGLYNGSYYTSFVQGTQTGNVSYTLPAAAPAADGQVLAGTTAGVLSWASNGEKWYAENSAAPSTAPSATGAGSVAFGSGAQASAVGMFVYGSSAGNGATSATYSNFIGNNAGNGATSASYSNFLGSSAGNGATSANSSNFIGRMAGYNATYANNSNFLGLNTGERATSASYSNFLGYAAGNYATSASYSTLIGYRAGQASSAENSIGSNNIIMGTNISLPAATANAINIGGVLFGTGTYSNTNTASTGAVSGGKIGIGVVTPVQTLEVNGDLGLYNGSYYTSFVQGTQTGNVSYTLPAAAPTASGQVLAGTTAGVLSWASNGGLKWYAENSAAPSTAPSATGAGSVAFGSGAQAAAAGMFVYGASAGNGATAAASYSNFLGPQAGNGATNASNSNFIGNNAGKDATSATDSNFLGYMAGASAASATYSNFIGNNAGNTATSATYSNFIGHYAGKYAANASYSTLIGYRAGQATSTENSIGSNNIIMGTNISLPAATANAINIGGVLFGTGTYSSTATLPSTTAVSGGKIGIGVVTPVQTLEVKGDLGLYNGSYYTSFVQGTQTGNVSYTLPAAAPTADGQVLAGTTAGVLSWASNGEKWYAENSAAPSTAPSATGTGSVAFGSSAQASAAGMFVYGASAGNGATSASNSNFLGASAGKDATSATYSNFLGYNAGLTATNATYSNFLGYMAGKDATSATYSNFLGSSAGISATSATNSNFLGHMTGYSATDASNSNFIGNYAGKYAANASYSTLIGYQAGQASSAESSIGSNNIIMGTNISLPAATANAINIGGVLFGTGTYSNTTTTSTRAVSGGKIGIGVVTPVQTLEVNGDLGLYNGSYYTSFVQGTQTGNVSYTLPAAAPAADGQVLASTTAGVLSWTAGGGANTVGTIDSQAKSVDGATISNNKLYLQTADALVPGLLSTGAQTIAGEKTWSNDAGFTGTVTANNLKVGSPVVDVITMDGGDLMVAGDAEFDGSVCVQGTLTTPSDERLKQNVATLTGVLSKIEQLRGVRFEFRDQQKYATGPQIGVIAQELQKVFPELVIQGADGYLAVNYSQLTGVLIQAVKEQQQEIDLLKAQMQQVMKKLGIE